MCHASTFLDLIEGLSFKVNPGDPSVDIDITWMEVRGSVRFLYLKLLSNLLRGRETEMGYIYPGRQCWSLPPTRTMLMFGLVKHRHSQCRCLTPVKKSTDLGSAMKCKIIIHVFIMPISQHVGPLELNLKPTRSYRYWIYGQETNQGTLFANILSEFTGKTWDLKRFGHIPLPEAHAPD